MARSSSSTLKPEDPVYNLSDDSSGVKADLADAHQRHTKVRASKNEQRKVLGYQTVLQRMVVEAAGPPSPNPWDADKPRANEGATLESWERQIQLLDPHDSPIYSIRNPLVGRLLESLMIDFGRPTHSSFMDDTYNVYLSQQERAAISFRAFKKVVVVYGDPLCDSKKASYVFEEFRRFCKRRHCRVAVVGASSNLAAHAQTMSWVCMEFGVEKVFNPMRNEVLNERAGKTITRTNRKLVRDGVVLFLYEPRRGVLPQLEQELRDVYTGWREERRLKNVPQAYSAVVDPFALSGVTRYLFTRGPDGKPNSLAGLIWLGNSSGYLLEPCIQSASAPKGTTGFLVTHAMGLLRDENVHYMTFGVEAMRHLGEITSMSSFTAKMSRRVYSAVSDAFDLEGRQIFHQSFYPEKDRHDPLYLLFPPGILHFSMYQAVLKASHVSPRVVWRHWQTDRSSKRQEGNSTRQEGKPPRVSTVVEEKTK
ncbi:hypothetical protein PV08_01142 [Exophiala spinifera]|uniref:Phosphatidylglycerol lysyltransferase C-terminal domain-containing protein n=1 Tax=Exophiala spinifera TaxID=91928 RepID=A0A0D2A734_9EURO|nr:uncharacterized protein PV08_01142 [Exophiala spinifera]KIW20567.1 hypothetical protein PV08_01142 [Exophiala spinifera]